MSLWAWFTYSSLYSWTALKLPFSLTLWQHLYSLNVLLVIQETADTFGVLCLVVLFISAQLLSRNFLFSVFLSTSSQALSSEDVARSSSTSFLPNTVKPLATISISLRHLRTLISTPVSNLKNTLFK